MTDQVVDSSADESAFESGFNDTRSQVQAPVSKPESKPETPAQQPQQTQKVEQPVQKQESAEQTPPDPLADVRGELSSLKEQLGAIGKIEARLRNFEGNLGYINTTLKTAVASAKAVDQGGGIAPTTTQILSASKTSERWSRLKEDFPDWVAAMEEQFAELRKSIPQPQNIDVAQLQNEIGTSINERLTQSLAEAKAEAKAEARQLALVDFKYDGWEETVNTPDFKAWKEKQSAEVQALADSAQAKDAIRMLDLYEEARKKALKVAQQKQANENRLRNAVTPPSVPGPQPTTLNENDVFENSFYAVRGR